MRRRRPPSPSGDVLPLELMPSPSSVLFGAFTKVMADGRRGLDMEVHARLEKAEAVRRRGFDEFFADRGISTKFADRDPRYLEVMERSRAHWGLNQQGNPLSG